MKLLELIFNIALIFDKARRIKQDPEARAKSAQLGVSSIIFSVATAVCFIIGALILKVVIDTGSIIILILVGLFGVAFIIGALFSLLHAVISFALQCSINRRPITWIALAVLIIAIAGTAIGTVLILS